MVSYHSPIISENGKRNACPKNVSLKYFHIISKYGSLPFVSMLNAFILFFYLRKNVRAGDVVFNFLPELLFFPRRRGVKFISVINDDFASMAPRYSSWWVRFLMKKMAQMSAATLYTSTELMRRYPARKQVLFYPWADKVSVSKEEKRNIILYWGYMSIALDYEKIEEMANQIQNSALDFSILLVGPVASNVENRVRRLVADYECINIMPATDLSNIETQRVLFGIELISPTFDNAKQLEFPNKGPRLLSYGIPLVYSGCDLLPCRFFIRYQGNFSKIVHDIAVASNEISSAIDYYFIENNSGTRLNDLRGLID